MVSLEFFPKRVLGTIVLNPHSFADEIKRPPEVEVPLVTRDNRTEVMNKVLNWLTVEGKVQRRGQEATSIIAEELYPLSRTERSVINVNSGVQF